MVAAFTGCSREQQEVIVPNEEEEFVKGKNCQNFRIFENLAQMRNNNGVIFNDFERYSKYCSKRIYTIRKKLKFHGGMKSKSYAYRKPLMQQHQLSDVRILHLPLIMSERCLSSSRILASSDGTAMNRLRAIHHSKSRLAKSVVFCRRLIDACEEAGCSIWTKFEADIYLSLNRANFNYEKKKFKDSYYDYMTVKKSMQFLYSYSDDTEQTKRFFIEQIRFIDERLHECMYMLNVQFDDAQFDFNSSFENGDFPKFKDIIMERKFVQNIMVSDNLNYFWFAKEHVFRQILLDNTLKLISTDSHAKSLSDWEMILKKCDLLIHHNKLNNNQASLMYCKYLKTEVFKNILRLSHIKLLQCIFEHLNLKKLQKIFIISLRLIEMIYLQLNMIQSYNECSKHDTFINNLKEEEKAYQLIILVVLRVSFAKYLPSSVFELNQLDQIISRVEYNNQNMNKFNNFDQYVDTIRNVKEQALTIEKSSNNPIQNKHLLKEPNNEPLKLKTFWPIKANIRNYLKYPHVDISTCDDKEPERNQKSMLGSIFSWFSGNK